LNDHPIEILESMGVDAPPVMKLAVYVLTSELPIMQRAMRMHSEWHDLRRELDRIEIHDRVWDRRHTAIVARVRDLQRDLSRVYDDLREEIHPLMIWLQPAAEA
jgi:hypothetical protein